MECRRWKSATYLLGRSSFPSGEFSSGMNVPKTITREIDDLSCSLRGGPASSIGPPACYPFPMPGALEQGDLAAPQDAELVRVLMPSPLGPLGVELLGTAVTRLRIDPPEAERGSFIPFHLLE